LFSERVLPGIAHLLENFVPYRRYIDHIRAIEREYTEKSDIARHAFHELRFGRGPSGDELAADIRELRTEIIGRFQAAVDEIPELLQHDIGMRGVMYAFGELIRYYERGVGRTVEWAEYSEWFVDLLNRLFEDQWFEWEAPDKAQLHLHVTRDHNDTVVNYRLAHAENGFGAMMVLAVSGYGRAFTEYPTEEVWEEVWEDHATETLVYTLLKGYRRQFRILLKEDYPNRGDGYKVAVEENAKKEMNKHLEALLGRLAHLTG